VRSLLEFAERIGWVNNKWGEVRWKGEEERVDMLLRERVEGKGGLMRERGERRRREMLERARIRGRVNWLKRKLERDEEVDLEG